MKNINAIAILTISALLFNTPKLSAQTAREIGAQPAYYASGATTNSTLVATGWRTLESLTVTNTTATIYYLKFYNTAAAPTCGSGTPVLSYPIPASTSGNGISPSLGMGVGFPLGIGFCLTGAQVDGDTTSAATGVIINLGYK